MPPTFDPRRVAGQSTLFVLWQVVEMSVRFLKASLAVRGGFLLFFLRSLPLAILCGGLPATPVWAQSDLTVGIAPRLEKIAGTYRVEIIFLQPSFPVDTPHGRIDGRAAVTRSLEHYVPLLAAEFTLYPPELIERSALKRLVLCADLTFAGQRRNAVPDFEHDVLYLDVSRGTHSKSYLRTVIHHELFHILDYRDDGLLYQDDRWVALNQKGFRYGSGGRAAQDNHQMSLLTEETPGFLTAYSQTGVEEDKAETFAHLIVHSDHVLQRAARDPVIEAKVQRIKELMASFCPRMNDTFWSRARALDRSDQ